MPGLVPGICVFLLRDIGDAIQREKSIKRWPRAYKVRLIHASNPDWTDLYDQLL
jgi:putative endonuclease